MHEALVCDGGILLLQRSLAGRKLLLLLLLVLNLRLLKS
jgi:hypothetical protein